MKSARPPRFGAQPLVVFITNKMRRVKKQNLLTSQPNRGTSLKEARKRILIVDDDLEIQDTFSTIFEKAGFEFEIKKDGKDLLKNKFTPPDLFLIGKQLSGDEGLDICRHLKKHKQTRNIPIIMISAASNIGSLAQEAGADSYIEKPFEMEKLLKLVNFYVYGNEEPHLNDK